MRCKGSINEVYYLINMNSKRRWWKKKQREENYYKNITRKDYEIEEHKCLDWKRPIWMPGTMNEKYPLLQEKESDLIQRGRNKKDIIRLFISNAAIKIPRKRKQKSTKE